jgi:hypothetical protein
MGLSASVFLNLGVCRIAYTVPAIPDTNLTARPSFGLPGLACVTRVPR